MTRATLVGIFTVSEAGGPAVARSTVEAQPGMGLKGDRHARPAGSPARRREVTLIEAEALEQLVALGLPLAPGASRRQLVTRGVALSDLVGRRFRVGRVLLQGTGPCRPCEHLESLTAPGVRAALEGRGGLCATVLEGGLLTLGDTLAPEPA